MVLLQIEYKVYPPIGHFFAARSAAALVSAAHDLIQNVHCEGELTWIPRESWNRLRPAAPAWIMRGICMDHGGHLIHPGVGQMEPKDCRLEHPPFQRIPGRLGQFSKRTDQGRLVKCGPDVTAEALDCRHSQIRNRNPSHVCCAKHFASTSRREHAEAQFHIELHPHARSVRQTVRCKQSCRERTVRITSDQYSPIDLLAEIVRRRGTTAADTRRFFVDEKAKHDWLVEEWTSRIDAMLESFRRYGFDVHATQHIRDQGVDILLRADDHHGKSWKLGLQVKGELEAQRDKKKKAGQESMIGTLKRQAFEASSIVDEWWVLCCFDQTEHQALVQGISAELIGAKKLLPIKVLDSRACAAALGLSDAEVDAFCTLFLCRDDEILKAARTEVVDLHPAASLFVLKHLASALSDGEHISREEVAAALEDFVQDVEEENEEDHASSDDDDEHDSELLAVDQEEDADEDFSEVEDVDTREPMEVHDVLNELESSGFLEWISNQDSYRLVPTTFPGLCALFFEARVRHELHPVAASEYMRWLVRSHW